MNQEEKYVDCEVKGESIKDKAKRKGEAAFETFKGFTSKVWDEIKKNPIATIAISGVATTLIRQMGLNHRQKVEREMGLRSVYDRSEGRRYYLKRQPTRRQEEEISRLREMGISWGDIIRKLKL